MERLFTIGVYGFEAGGFLRTLEEAGIDLFLDLRRRRGVRGREYAWANATRLQAALAERGIPYRHILDLAPTNETRAVQYRIDDAAGVAKRQRSVLAPEYIAAYRAEAMDPFDWAVLINDLALVQRPVLFCVEQSATACHRSLVAERLAAGTGVPVEHLAP